MVNSKGAAAAAFAVVGNTGNNADGVLPAGHTDSSGRGSESGGGGGAAAAAVAVAHSRRRKMGRSVIRRWIYC